MDFEPQSKLGPLPSAEREELNEGEEWSWLLPYLSVRDSARLYLVDLGSGDGTRALWLLKNIPSLLYSGFEPNPKLLRTGMAQIGQNQDCATISPYSGLSSLPLETSSQDCVLTLDLLEYMRMDQVYMTCAEARRVLKPGAIWILRSLYLEQKGIKSWPHRLWWKITQSLPGLSRESRPINLHHYISPEDWLIKDEKYIRLRGFTRQVVVLERLPE